MTKERIFLYVYILIALIDVGLLIPERQSSRELVQVNREFESVKSGIEGLRSFQDSLFGNVDFRNRVLDTLSKGTNLRQLQAEQKEKLNKEIERLISINTDLGRSIKKYNIWEATANLTRVIFVCMTIPVIIYVFKRR